MDSIKAINSWPPKTLEASYKFDLHAQNNSALPDRAKDMVASFMAEVQRELSDAVLKYNQENPDRIVTKIDLIENQHLEINNPESGFVSFKPYSHYVITSVKRTELENKA